MLITAPLVASPDDYLTDPNRQDKLCQVIGETPNIAVPPRDRLWASEHCACDSRLGCGRPGSYRYDSLMSAARKADLDRRRAARAAEKKRLVEELESDMKQRAEEAAAAKKRAPAVVAGRKATADLRKSYWACASALHLEQSATLGPKPSITPNPKSIAVPDLERAPIPDVIAGPDLKPAPIPDPKPVAVPGLTLAAVPEPALIAIPNPTSGAIPDPESTAIPDPEQSVTPALKDIAAPGPGRSVRSDPKQSTCAAQANELEAACAAQGLQVYRDDESDDECYVRVLAAPELSNAEQSWVRRACKDLSSNTEPSDDRCYVCGAVLTAQSRGAQFECDATKATCRARILKNMKRDISSCLASETAETRNDSK